MQAGSTGKNFEQLHGQNTLPAWHKQNIPPPGIRRKHLLVRAVAASCRSSAAPMTGLSALPPPSGTAADRATALKGAAGATSMSGAIPQAGAGKARGGCGGRRRQVLPLSKLLQPAAGSGWRSYIEISDGDVANCASGQPQWQAQQRCQGRVGGPTKDSGMMESRGCYFPKPDLLNNISF